MALRRPLNGSSRQFCQIRISTQHSNPHVLSRHLARFREHEIEMMIRMQIKFEKGTVYYLFFQIELLKKDLSFLILIFFPNPSCGEFHLLRNKLT